MQTKELRIGNYIDYERTTHIVESISNLDNLIGSWWVKDGKPKIEYSPKDAGGALEEDPYLDNTKNYKPIPLTEEWLLKFGLKIGYLKIDDFEISYYNQVFYFNISECPNECAGYGVELKYVHQLQNLYFALTGEELEIKEKV